MYIGKSGVLKLNTFYVDKSNIHNEKKYYEAIEAEIAFLIRFKTGKWPECQCEIHFHNIPYAKQIAEKIYNKISIV